MARAGEHNFGRLLAAPIGADYEPEAPPPEYRPPPPRDRPRLAPPGRVPRVRGMTLAEANDPRRLSFEHYMQEITGGAPEYAPPAETLRRGFEPPDAPQQSDIAAMEDAAWNDAVASVRARAAGSKDRDPTLLRQEANRELAPLRRMASRDRRTADFFAREFGRQGASRSAGPAAAR